MTDTLPEIGDVPPHYSHRMLCFLLLLYSTVAYWEKKDADKKQNGSLASGQGERVSPHVTYNTHNPTNSTYCHGDFRFSHALFLNQVLSVLRHLKHPTNQTAWNCELPQINYNARKDSLFSAQEVRCCFSLTLHFDNLTKALATYNLINDNLKQSEA